jgi:hypothetical protein
MLLRKLIRKHGYVEFVSEGTEDTIYEGHRMSKKKKRASFADDSTTPKKEAEGVYPPGQPTVPSAQPGQQDQMAQMLQTFQNMLGTLITGGAQQYQSAVPFTPETKKPEAPVHDVVMPSTLKRGIVAQQALDIHPLYGRLFLDEDGELLGGIPKGCTITITGPPYTGKTRSAMEMMIRALQQGMKVAFVVAEEGFYDDADSGRNDLFSRFLKMAEVITGMKEKAFRKKYDDKYVIIPNQYHLGKTWSDFIRDYRYAVEELGIRFILIDSINMLDPSKLNTVENLNALKTYNHSKGVTAVVIGQIKDSGLPQGGEALFHTSEVALHMFTQYMSSKDMAAQWGAQYKDYVPMITARSKVCGAISFPVKTYLDNEQGLLRADAIQPPENVFPKNFYEEELKKKPKAKATSKSKTKKSPSKKKAKKKS